MYWIKVLIFFTWYASVLAQQLGRRYESLHISWLKWLEDRCSLSEGYKDLLSCDHDIIYTTNDHGVSDEKEEHE